jgi:SOS response regulatory protein OraA/RecX
MSVQDHFPYALSVAYRYLATRPRAESELRAHLKRKSPLFIPPIIDRVVAHLSELSYLDDAAFVRWYLGPRVLSRKKSVSLLKRELEHLGIRRELIEEELSLLQSPKTSAESGPELKSDEERAEAAIRTLWDRSEYLSKEKRYQRAYSYLARRGFPFDVIKKTIAKYQGIE